MQTLTPQQQTFLQHYNVFALIEGTVEASSELWEEIHENSESCFSFEEWEDFCATYNLC